MEPWAIWVDIEGFSRFFESDNKVAHAFRELVRGIYRIGACRYPQGRDRLFAYQVGDGFVIGADREETSLERPVAIAIALMRHVAVTGRFVKAGIADGVLEGANWYPEEIRDCLRQNGQVCMGEGSMMGGTFVTGPGLIRSYRTAQNAPSGCLIVLDQKDEARVPDGYPKLTVPGKSQCKELVSIDWVHADDLLISEIQRKAKLCMPEPKELECLLRDYCDDTQPPCDWKRNVFKYLSIPCGETR